MMVFWRKSVLNFSKRNIEFDTREFIYDQRRNLFNTSTAQMLFIVEGGKENLEVQVQDAAQSMQPVEAIADSIEGDPMMKVMRKAILSNSWSSSEFSISLII